MNKRILKSIVAVGLALCLCFLAVIISPADIIKANNIKKAVDEGVPKAENAEIKMSPEKIEKNKNNEISTYDLTDSMVSYDEATGIHYVNNIIIVFFEDNVSEERKTEIAENVDGVCAGRMDTVNQWQIKVAKNDYAGLNRICEELKALPDVITALLDNAHKYDGMVIPNDPWSNPTWNENSPSGSEWGIEATQLLSTWDYNEHFSNVKVGVVDKGFNLSHEDLGTNVSFAVPANVNKNSPDQHGTHVLGTIAAKANNSKGITGVIWNPTVYVHDGLPITGQTWNADTEIMAGFVGCVQNGAKAINFSLGIVLLDEERLTPAEIAAESAFVCAYMALLLNQGYEFVVVQSAGNGTLSGISIDAINNGLFCCVTSTNTGQTAAMAQKINDRIIIVGAARLNTMAGVYEQAYFSNAGSQVDICAPGYGIRSLDLNSNAYIGLAGTSMASPHVTGIAGLLWAVNPDLTGREVRNIILDTENTIATVYDSTDYRHTLVDTYNMVNAKLCVEDAIDTYKADYSAIDELIVYINTLNPDDYTPESFENLTGAVNAVVRDLTKNRQSEVTEMENAIRMALTALVPVSIVNLTVRQDSATQIKENNIIMGLKPGITVSEFENQYVEVQGNARLEYSSSPLGTGVIVSLIDNASENTVATYTIIIFGDLDGNGVVNNQDFNILSLHAKSKSRLPAGSPQLLAADVDQSGIVNQSDISTMNNALSGKAVLSQTRF